MIILWLVWFGVIVLGVAWFSLVALLCRQIAAGKWEPDYWPPDPTSAAQPVGLEDLRHHLTEELPHTVVQVRFTQEGGFSES